MKEIVISSLSRVNVDKLDQDLRAGFASEYRGLSIRRQRLIIFVVDSVSDVARDAMINLAEVHDPDELTPEQIAERNRAQELQALKADLQAMDPDNLDAAALQIIGKAVLLYFGRVGLLD